MKNITSGLVGLLFLGVALSAVYADNGYLAIGRGGQRFDISADKITLLPDEQRKTCEGNVKVVQGNITLTCDKLVIDYDADKGTAQKGSYPGNWQADGNIKSITASGNVKIVQDDRIATAGKAFFDRINRIIKLTENPRIWQGRDAGIANAIIMYLDENRWEFQGDAGNPIKFTIHPGELKNRKKK